MAVASPETRATQRRLATIRLAERAASEQTGRPVNDYRAPAGERARAVAGERTKPVDAESPAKRIRFKSSVALVAKQEGRLRNCYAVCQRSKLTVIDRNSYRQREAVMMSQPSTVESLPSSSSPLPQAAAVPTVKGQSQAVVGDESCATKRRLYIRAAERAAAQREGRPVNYYRALAGERAMLVDAASPAEEIRSGKRARAVDAAPPAKEMCSGERARPVDVATPTKKKKSKSDPAWTAAISAEKVAAQREGRPCNYYAVSQRIKANNLVEYLRAPPVPAPCPLDSAVLSELEATTFIRLMSRHNTRVDAEARPQGMCLGALKSWCKGVNLSSATSEHPHLARLCCDLIRAAKPDFLFTSIQVNKNYASALHVDSGNLGPSLIIGFGDYKRGNVYVHGMGELPVHNQWQLFDGNVPHLTCPFVGNRYTLIFFTNQSYDLVPPKDVEQMRQLGFHWPKAGISKADYGPKEARLAAARLVLPASLKHMAGSEYKGKPANKIVLTAKRKRANKKTAATRAALRNQAPSTSLVAS